MSAEVFYKVSITLSKIPKYGFFHPLYYRTREAAERRVEVDLLAALEQEPTWVRGVVQGNYAWTLKDPNDRNRTSFMVEVHELSFDGDK